MTHKIALTREFLEQALKEMNEKSMDALHIHPYDPDTCKPIAEMAKDIESKGSCLLFGYHTRIHYGKDLIKTYSFLKG